MDERKLEKRFHRLEELVVSQGRQIEALMAALGAGVLAIEALEKQSKHLGREIHEIERRLKPHHFPATTGVHVTAA